MMKYILFIVVFVFSASVTAQDWESDYKDAVAHAKKDNKPLILVFAGSDWCAPCIKLDREIWQSEPFRTYSATNYVLFRADFPRKKANQLPTDQVLQNSQLAEKYNPQGHFPLVVVLNADEKVLGTSAYQKIPPEEYISLLNSFLK